MNKKTEAYQPGIPVADTVGHGFPSVSAKRLLWSLAGLILCFSRPLYGLALFAAKEKLFSHILLIPFVSLYLIWLQRNSFSDNSAPNRSVAMRLIAAGIALISIYGALLAFGPPLEPASALVLPVGSFVLLFVGICGAFLGQQAFRAFAFPFGFLIFMVPIPEFLVAEIESLLQYGSAFVATLLFHAAGTPLFREDLALQLPGIRLEVAPECSGIHSSFALLITSVVAGYFFLRSPGARTVLAAAVVPIAFLRNGFRIFTIGELCVHISPDMIHSYIHIHGGPLFFALSLIPFFALLIGLIRFERRRLGPPAII